MNLQGAMTALVTPFKNGKVDEPALESLIEFQISEGIHALVICGTTGESPTLSHEEHDGVIEQSVKIARGRVPIIAGTGSNNTIEAVRLTRHAEKVGADAVLVVAPYYNKPTQEGLYQYFREVAQSTGLPLLVYNIPGRTGVNVLPDTLGRLREIKNMVGIKEASGSLQQASEVLHRCGNDFILLSGDDGITLPMMAIGGRGAISVASNVLPKRVAQMVEAALSNRWEEARAIHYELLPWAIHLFCETNPIPIKAALAMIGKIGEEIRSPLTPASPSTREKLRSLLKQFRLL
jgi:4-hydroxy-tetrahydrodipicolinate synthase